jgi:multidrug efflux pump subunit AcrA (membrane-fusion protein)
VKVSVGSSVKTGQWLFTYTDVMGRDVKVKAVASGVVRSIDTTAGLRTSGSVMTIGSNSPVVSVFVSEYDADLVALKQSGTIELDAISATFEGTVTRIGQVAQALSGIKQYEVLLKVSDLPEGARFGMSATAVIKVLTKENVLAVPLNALVGDEDTLVDLLVTDASGNQTVKRVQVELGTFGDSYAEVVSGLSVGDLVITGLKGDVPAPVNFGPPPGARDGA